MWQHTQGVVGFLITVLLQIYNEISQWKNCENRLRFDRDITTSIVATFHGTRCTRDANYRVALFTQRRVFRLNSQMKRSDFHLGKSQRVVVAGPRLPHHAVSWWWVATAQVGAVQVGVVATAVPPGTFEQHGTRLLVYVVVLVSSAELVSTMMLRQRIACK